MDKLDTQLKRGTLELCVLSLLSKGDCYGYEIVRKISRCIDITEGTVYPLLKRLKDNKLIKSYLSEAESGGPARKYYTLTDTGRLTAESQLAEWIRFVGGVTKILGLFPKQYSYETEELS